MSRREYGSGSIHQRSSDGRWIGALEAGWTADGKRRRIVVTGKTKTIVKNKLKEKRDALERGEVVASDRVTVKQWVETYLELRTQPPQALRPKAWQAAASPLRKWVIPTIGHRRVSQLTPGDIRAVQQAQFDAIDKRFPHGRSVSTADATHRAFKTCLNRAVAEGHTVPQRVLAMPGPGMGPSDRTAIPVKDALECLAAVAGVPSSSQWLLTLLYGARSGEIRGLTDDAIDFDTMTIDLAWQLQALNYKDRRRPELGFQYPRNHEVKHLTMGWHLTRPKSKKGIRVLPMHTAVAKALEKWLKVRPANPWGLVYPTARGTPCNDKVHREEFWAIQCAAGVGHPGGRWYHVHECRNLAATSLDKVKASDNVITSLLGHASIVTSRSYMTAELDAKREAIDAVAERLGL